MYRSKRMLPDCVALVSRGHATLHLAVSVGMSVGQYVGQLVCRLVSMLVSLSVRHIFELPKVSALLLLPNSPRLDCRVSGLVHAQCSQWKCHVLPNFYATLYYNFSINSNKIQDNQMGTFLVHLKAASRVIVFVKKIESIILNNGKRGKQSNFTVL